MTYQWDDRKVLILTKEERRQLRALLLRAFQNSSFDQVEAAHTMLRRVDGRLPTVTDLQSVRLNTVSQVATLHPPADVLEWHRQHPGQPFEYRVGPFYKAGDEPKPGEIPAATGWYERRLWTSQHMALARPTIRAGEALMPRIEHVWVFATDLDAHRPRGQG